MISCEYLFDRSSGPGKRILPDRFCKDRKLSAVEYDNSYIIPFGVDVFWKTDLSGGMFDRNGVFVKGSHYTPGVKLASDVIDIRNPNIVCRHEKVIFLGMLFDAWGHCLCDNLRRLWFLFSDIYREKYKDCKLVYFPLSGKRSNNFIYQNPPRFMKDLFEIIGIDFCRLVPVTEPTVFDSIVLPDQSFWEDDDGTRWFCSEYRMILDKIRDFQKQNYVFRPEYNKVYYSNAKSNRSGSIGEEKLEQFFRSRGYSIVYPEEFSVNEQLNILANCHYFASTVGSCSHNMIFLPENSDVILIPRDDTINGYQIIMNQIYEQNIRYVDSTLSVMPEVLHKWDGPFFFFDSDELYSAFDEKPQISRKCRIEGFDKYVSSVKKWSDMKNHYVSFVYMRGLVKYLGVSRCVRLFIPMFCYRLCRLFSRAVSNCKKN